MQGIMPTDMAPALTEHVVLVGRKTNDLIKW